MNLLEFNVPEWIYVALSLGILMLVLWRVFWKPIGRILDERQKRVEQAMSDAEAAAAEKKRMEAYRADLQNDLDQQTAKMMQEARVRAGKEYDRIVADAEERAKSIVKAAEARTRMESEAAAANAKAEIKAAALAVAAALLEANLSPEQNERLMEAALKQRSVQ